MCPRRLFSQRRPQRRLGNVLGQRKRISGDLERGGSDRGEKVARYDFLQVSTRDWQLGKNTLGQFRKT